MRLLILSFLFALSLPQSVLACEKKEYRQFDFWLGEWQVSNSQNSQVSSSKISSINNGCGILEEYSTPTGFEGKSLNIYDKQKGKWHQTWVDNSGLLLQLDGEFKDGKMVLQGTTYDAKGIATLNQISWQQLEDGRVNQTWKTSADNGKNWQTLFDGYYSKVK
ncbi:hypothetical protein ACFSJY_05650 [Thalassotalea euphylliae]|uniref:hypothetical protein n=1 Tax=Thalassotalea euphylliae TaxID=1655234 RepID=UPI00362E1987